MILLQGATVLSVLWASSANMGLFGRYSWILIGVVVSGFLMGTVRALFKIKFGDEYSATRHSIDSFMEHWGTGLGIILLIYSGFRIFSGADSLFAANLHFAGIIFVAFFGSYFMAEFLLLKKHLSVLPTPNDIIDGTIKKYFMRLPWAEDGKYQSSQKSAFLAFAALGSEVAITGAIKLAGMSWNIPAAILSVSTLIHDVSGIMVLLMLLVHVTLVLGVKSHRKLLGAWFTGRVTRVRAHFPVQRENNAIETVRRMAE